MDMEKAKNQLAEVYAIVQKIDIMPTKHNVESLMIIMHDLDEVFNDLDRAQKTKPEPAAEEPAVTEDQI